jgi:copper chaperone CopZ
MKRTSMKRIALFAGLLSIAGQLAATTIEVEVNGLVCAFCAQGIEKSMKKLPATDDVFVSLDDRLVAVALKDGQDIDDTTLKQTITDAGYSAVQIRRSEATLAEIRARVAAKGSAEGRGDHDG